MLNFTAARAVTKTMHKTIILDRSTLDFYYTFDMAMFVCREACELLARKLSPTHQYVITFSDEYSPGYRRIQSRYSGEAKTKSHEFGLTWRQQAWIKALGLKTLNELNGHFYVKITPFE